MNRQAPLRITLCLLSLGLLINACNDAPTTSLEEVGGVQVTYTESSEGTSEKYVANLAINGMACQMMCGNMISTTLAQLDGVIETNIEFESAGQANFAVVEFDATKVSEKDMIAAVEKLADGHYKVESVNVVHYLPAKTTTDDQRTSYNQRIDYKLPNFFSVFSRIF